MTSREEFLTELDEINDENEVRLRVRSGDYSKAKKIITEEWLHRREATSKQALAGC